jgi:orotate phosphoribosyltransferase
MASGASILARAGALIENTHVVYTSRRHGIAYLNKDALYPHPTYTWDICEKMAEPFINGGIEVVVAPALGGIILANNIAHHLTLKTGREVLGLYAEREEVSIHSATRTESIFVAGKKHELQAGDEVVIKKKSFVFKRGQDKLLQGKRALAAEDVLTTGGSAMRMGEAALKCGAKIVDLTVINSGGMTAEQMGVSKLKGVLDIKLQTWSKEECAISGPCSQKVPINTTVGHGKQFLEEKK